MKKTGLYMSHNVNDLKTRSFNQYHIKFSKNLLI